jgi:hypothetical protein
MASIHLSAPHTNEQLRFPADFRKRFLNMPCYRGGLDLAADGGTSLPTFVYHYYDGNNGGTPTLGINHLVFDSDGWPSLQ